MSRTEWVLGILLVILLAVVIVLGLLFWLRPGLGNPSAIPEIGNVPVAPTSVFAGQTALLAYAPARSAALAWQPDATLYKASATWPQGATRDEMVSGANTWNFQFYAPGVEEIASFAIVEGEATRTNQREVDRPLSPLDATGWNLDSGAAIRQVLASGGDEFLQDAGVTTLTMTLTTSNETGRIEWLISLFSNETGAAYTVRLDANSGAVLDVIQAP